MRVEVARREHRALLQSFLERRLDMPVPGAQKLNPTVVHLDSRETLISPGTKHPYYYVVLQGIMRVAVVTEEGVERVTQIIEPGQTIAVPMMYRSRWLGNIDSRSPSVAAVLRESAAGAPYLVTALKPARLLRMSYAQLEEAAEGDAGLTAVMLHHLTVFAAVTEASNIELLTMSPQRRYREFLKHRSHLLELVTLKDIASLLGVTPESLSRIRGREGEAADTRRRDVARVS